MSTDYILKSKGGAAEAEPSPSGAPGGAGAASAEASGGADAGASGAEAGVSRPAADSTAAFAGGMGAEAVFVRVWPVLCLAVSAVTALLFCALWFMGGFWYASTFAHAGVVAVVGTLASAFGTLLFELGALAVPAMKRRRAFFYSYAVWALALLPCCAVSGVIDFVFSNWLWWRLESVLGAVAASVFRAGLVYLLPLILYGGACTSLRDMLSESENA